MRHQRVLFCNIAWMAGYRGRLPGETLASGGAYVVTHGTGHEIGNFLEYRRRCYGFVRPTKGSGIRLDRIDPTWISGDDMPGVTVIWTAKRPEGGRVVVGWYKNARVYSRWQKHTGARETFYADHGLEWYLIETKVGDAHLLPTDYRSFPIPRAKRGHSGMGQSNVWYADGERSKPWFAEVMRLIESHGTPRRVGSGVGRQLDPKRRRAIEKAAVHAVQEFYEDGGYTVVSVEAESKGWDLECTRAGVCLRIEVKGTSLPEFTVELTPNEYEAFRGNHNDFRVAVVTNALSSPCTQIFSYSHPHRAWISDKGLSLQIEKRVSAILRKG